MDEFAKEGKDLAQLPLRKSKFRESDQLTDSDKRDVDFLFSSWDIMKKKETVASANPTYFKKHVQMNAEMRFLLIEWMCDSACDLNFQRQTFHLAVNYLDKFLSDHPGDYDGDIQWLGAACLHLAAKMEEPTIPDALQFVAFDYENNSDDKKDSAMLPLSTRKQDAANTLVNYENTILTVLQWDLRLPTSYEWLMLYFQVAAILYPGAYGDPACATNRIVKRRFQILSFIAATKRLDSFIADSDSLTYKNSFLAAIAFCEVTENYDGAHMITGYKMEEHMLEWSHTFGQGDLGTHHTLEKHNLFTEIVDKQLESFSNENRDHDEDEDYGIYDTICTWDRTDD